ncbi:MAG: TraB/GumN family protein [Deltaproteobacteria bacterium]|nr:TraB/GumN family protein [Deltaproteobacteria bacterium]
MHLLLARLLLLPALALLASCATPPSGAVDSGQLVFWEIRPLEGEDGVAYLLGSIHVGRERLDFDPAIRAALPDASLLVYEVSPGASDPENMAIAIMEMGRLPAGQTLENLLSAETWEAFEKRLAKEGLPAENFAVFEPWVATLQLLGLSLAAANANVEFGIEQQILEMTEGSATIGLETPDFQLGLFDALPMETQIYLLEEALTPESQAADFVDLVFAAWKVGDLEMLERLIVPEADDPKLDVFFESVFLERNRNMATGIAELLEEPGRYFVTLGVGHMLGDEGIPALLARKGFRVKRVPRTGATPRG